MFLSVLYTLFTIFLQFDFNGSPFVIISIINKSERNNVIFQFVKINFLIIDKNFTVKTVNGFFFLCYDLRFVLLYLLLLYRGTQNMNIQVI